MALSIDELKQLSQQLFFDNVSEEIEPEDLRFFLNELMNAVQEASTPEKENKGVAAALVQGLIGGAGNDANTLYKLRLLISALQTAIDQLKNSNQVPTQTRVTKVGTITQSPDNPYQYIIAGYEWLINNVAFSLNSKTLIADPAHETLSRTDLIVLNDQGTTALIKGANGPVLGPQPLYDSNKSIVIGIIPITPNGPEVIPSPNDHKQNTDLKLAEGTAYESTAQEIRTKLDEEVYTDERALDALAEHVEDTENISVSFDPETRIFRFQLKADQSKYPIIYASDEAVPDSTFDAAQGYKPGDVFIAYSSQLYICLYAGAGSANWFQAASISDIQSLIQNGEFVTKGQDENIWGKKLIQHASGIGFKQSSEGLGTLNIKGTNWQSNAERTINIVAGAMGGFAIGVVQGTVYLTITGNINQTAHFDVTDHPNNAGITYMQKIQAKAGILAHLDDITAALASVPSGSHIRGSYDITANPASYPKGLASDAVNATQVGNGSGSGNTIKKGDTWYVVNYTGTETIGSGLAINGNRALIVALVDDAGNSDADWTIIEHNIDLATASAPGLVKLINSLVSTATDAALTAAQGKALKDLIDALTTVVGAKADLVEGKVPASQLPAPSANTSSGIAAYDATLQTRYHPGDQVTSGGRFWSARTDVFIDQAGTAPPTNPAVTQNTYWTELSASHIQNTDTALRQTNGLPLTADQIVTSFTTLDNDQKTLKIYKSTNFNGF
jgi:hypothetical protein